MIAIGKKVRKQTGLTRAQIHKAIHRRKRPDKVFKGIAKQDKS